MMFSMPVISLALLPLFAKVSANVMSRAAAANSSSSQTSLSMCHISFVERIDLLTDISQALDPGVIATGFENDGQNPPVAGQVASQTSTNNFINFCATAANVPITNGKQIATGSCNPIPMGSIPATTNMPSCKFVNPKNQDNIAPNTSFNVTMAITNLATGTFVNPDTNYFAAPQALSSGGTITGHSHIVIEQISSLQQTTATDPKNFAFFLGLNSPAVGGVLTASVTKGLPAGTYRLASINTAANHQPVLGPVAQHGSFDDAVYVGFFTSLPILCMR